ncbi:MAG: hypothetical protein COT18_11800 [Elusimicrobia bacterium CG08_land_8_20_14_0_20_59_10]|nr:MAG: hypothetical protein COT18_11800 [Elusimicrobia bacterium CG08_land_8_20_14_0_20_59_10]
MLGKGSVQYVRQNEKADKLEKIIERFYDRISRPVLTDLSLDWNGLDVKDLSPEFIPDLFAGQPLLLHARYIKSGSAPVVIKGKLRGKPLKMTVNVNLPKKEPANGAMGPLWARSRITDLERLNLKKEDEDTRERIIMLALEHKLVTRYTSFVAVDTNTASAGKTPLLVPVESELPEGTQYEGFFGGADGAFAGGASRGMSAAAGSFSRSGAFGQAKFAGSALAAPSRNGHSAQSRGESASGGKVKSKGLAVKARELAERLFSTEDLVPGLALKLLELPTPRLLRQLVSRQDAGGAFTGPDGKKASAADQALALLALAKARSALGADAEASLRKAWACLRGMSPAGLNGREAVVKALKGGTHWKTAGVQRELAALGAMLEELK